MGPPVCFGGIADTQGCGGKAGLRRGTLVIWLKRVAGLSTAALERFLVRARRAVRLSGQINVLVTSSAAVRSLNRRFRGKDKATDVLSFPASSARRGKRALLAGEIAISADVATQNALRLGHSPAEEVKILALHGILHLAGFDHERDNGTMAREELRLRRVLRLPVGLIERTAAANRPLAKRTRRPAGVQTRRTE